ncbi:MAG: molecular chaperone [Bacteroidota bacterium]
MQLPGLLVKKSGSYRIALLFKGLFMMALFVVASFGDVYSQGNLLILPRRVVFEGNVKSQDLTLANTGNDTAKYQVSIVQMRMKDDGSFEQITTPDEGQFFAEKYLRFYPRTVTLAPKKSQIVKMQFAKSAKMEPGEYRSHIYFRAVPKTRALGENELVRDSASVTARLVPVFGITIPVIIRIGEPTTKVTMTDMSVEMVKDTLPKLKMTFNRAGNFSVYGDMIVTYISKDGKETKVASVKGVAVYTPNLSRRFQCNLDRIPGVDYKSGKLHIVFTTPVDTKLQKLAEADYILK